MSLQKQLDHSERTERYYSRYLGTCHCKDCIVLPSPFLCPNCNGELSRFQNGPEALLPKESQRCVACELPYPLWAKWRAIANKAQELQGVLSGLCLSLSVGSGDEHTTAEQYENRIREGISTLTRVESDRREKAENCLRQYKLGLERAIDFIEFDDMYNAHKVLKDTCKKSIGEAAFSSVKMPDEIETSWQTMASAPLDGSWILGRSGRRIYTMYCTNIETMPNGDTRPAWGEVEYDSVTPCFPRLWMPLPDRKEIQ